MKFRVQRSSILSDEVQPHPWTVRETYQEEYASGEITDRIGWFVEIDTAEQLIEFARIADDHIVIPHYGRPYILIQDMQIEF